MKEVQKYNVVGESYIWLQHVSYVLACINKDDNERNTKCANI